MRTGWRPCASAPILVGLGFEGWSSPPGMFQSPEQGTGPSPTLQASTGSGEVHAAADLPPAEVPMLASLTVLQPAGGELRHEGPLHLGQGQIPDPRLAVQRMQQAGVCGPGE